MENAGCVDIEKVVADLNKILTDACKFKKVSGKKIIYQQELGGRVMYLISPQAKMQPDGFFWVDITSEQLDLIKTGSDSIMLVRLENGDVVSIEKRDFLQILTEDCMKYNEHEGNHWKLYFYPGIVYSDAVYGFCREYEVQVVGGKSLKAKTWRNFVN